MESESNHLIEDANREEIQDHRKTPDGDRLRAFKHGWSDATDKGIMYNSIEESKTHQNMGNLFGWIYGESSDELKKKVWEQYIEVNREFLHKAW